MSIISDKPRIYLPFESLEEAKHWEVGQSYVVKMVLRQTSLDENGASFEVVDATSMESKDRARRKFLDAEVMMS